MAEGVEVGTGYITINASAKGAVRQVQQQFGGAMPAVGKKAGKNLGGGMAAGLTGALKPLLALFAVAKIGGFFKEANTEARESQKVGRVTEAIVKSTGGAAKITAKQVGELATAISNKTGVDDEAIQKGSNLLLTFKNVRNEAGQGADVFDRATQSAVDLSAAGFGSIDSASKMLGKALNDPVKGMNALNRAGVTFSAQQQKQIKGLVATGDLLGAQKIILGEVESQVGGVGAASASASEKARVGWDNLKEQIGTLLLPVIDRFFGFLTTKGIPALSRLVTWLSGVGKQAGPVAGIIDGQVSPALSGMVATVRRIGAVAMPILRAVVAEFRKNWPVIKPVVVSIFKTVGGIIRDVMKLVKFQIDTTLKVIQFIWSRWGDRITAFASSDFRTILKVISGAMKVIGGIVKVITGVMTGDWRKAGTGIRMIVGGLRDVVVAIFTNMGVRLRAGVASLMGHLRQGFASGVAAIGRAWDGLKEKAKAPVRFVIDTVLNNGLIGAFNKIAGFVGADKIGNISIPGFARGGWTGPGGRFQPAGIVHADEFVVSKPARRKIEQQAPGYLDFMNQHGKLPGYWLGGGVAPTNIASMSRHGGYPWARWAGDLNGPGNDFGQAVVAYKAGVVAAVKHLTTSYGKHIRINHGNERTLYAHLSKILVSPGQQVAAGQKIGEIGETGNAFGAHLHFELAGGSGPLSNAVDAVKSTVIDWASRLRSSLTSPLSKLSEISGSPFGSIVAKLPRKLADAMIDKAKGFTGSLAGSLGSLSGGTSGSNQALGRRLMLAAGFPASQWPALRRLGTGESGWRTNARNASSGAYGIPQALPGGKMASHGSDWRTNPATQIRWMLDYIKGRYGDPSGALSAWLGRSPHWYANGTLSAAPGWAMVGERGPELVNFKGGEKVLSNADSRGPGGPTINQYFPTSADPRSSAAASSGRIVAALAARGY